MYKKIICFAVLIVLSVSLFACQTGDDGLAEYKSSAFEELQLYALSKGEENYIAENWAKIEETVAQGKISIDGAKNKTNVESILNQSKNAIDEISAVIKENTEDMLELIMPFWSTFSGAWPGYPIELKHPDEKSVFECTVENGGFFIGGKSGNDQFASKRVIVRPGDTNGWWRADTIYWTYINIKNGEKQNNADQAFVEIILKTENKIAGYAVVETNKISPINYVGIFLASVIFPKIDGEFQNITEDYVKTEIEKIKQIKLENLEEE